MNKPEKMSKSRGNVVTIDEVVHGVRNVADGYVFRNHACEVVDYSALGVWRNQADGCYYTSTRTGLRPVFLCRESDIDEIPQLRFKGGVIDQHDRTHFVFRVRHC